MHRAARAGRTDQLVALMAECTDDEELERLRLELISVNMPVARSVATGYRSRGIASEDLEQIAYLALTKAARRFDPRAGHDFLSFCVPTVRGEVRRYFRDHGWMVRPPRRMQELQQQVSIAQSDLTLRLGRPPTTREVAAHLDEEVDHVLEAMDGRGCFTPTSLDQVVGEGDSTLGDLIGATESGVSSAEARMMLAPVMGGLRDRDRHIIAMRFFEGMTQREIAARIGVTQMQVSRLLARIFQDLRQAMGPPDESARTG